MRPKILLILREVRTREDMLQLCGDKDFEVMSTNTTTAALSLIITHEFDAVVTDLHVRKDEDDAVLLPIARYFKPNALIVAITDCLSVRETAMALRLGIKVVLSPYDLGQVAEFINAKMPSADAGIPGPKAFVCQEQKCTRMKAKVFS